MQEIAEIKKNHQWYYFSENDFLPVEKITSAPQVQPLAWTEAVRISSASSAPKICANGFDSYAVVNKKGILCFNDEKIEFAKDSFLFLQDTADSIVFADENPVFYFYRSTFFSEDEKEQKEDRPFLVEYDSLSKKFFPLVNYKNLNLEDNQQITDYFWNGTTWVCSVKKTESSSVDFTYFLWEPFVSLSEFSPALGSDIFSYKKISESEYRKYSTPKNFTDAPQELKELLNSVPKDLGFYISHSNGSGTSPICYFNNGKNSNVQNAKSQFVKNKNLTCAIFNDGTTYINSNGTTKAFRLPKLSAGFVYGAFVISKNTLYVSWEETEFYKTLRSGFLQVDLRSLL